MNREMSEERLAEEIAALRFALVDLTLFLDTHPEDTAALSMFAEYRKALSTCLDKYTAMYGPMTVLDTDTKNGWTWGMGPWPYEGR